jgi:hypothetical protein
MECPCCRECLVYDTAISRALDRMPSDDKFNSLDRRLPVEYVSYSNMSGAGADLNASTASVRNICKPCILYLYAGLLRGMAWHDAV